MENLMDLGGGVGLGGTLLIGAIAGWIAEKLTGSNVGLLMNVITGVIGSFIGAYIANYAGINVGEIVPGWFWSNLLVSAVGATILIAVLKVLLGRRNR